MKNLARACLPLLIFFLTACQHQRPAVSVGNCLQSFGSGSRQMVVVSAKGGSNPAAVAIGLYEWNGTSWKSVGNAVDGVAGVNGLAPPGAKREGDGRTPSGAFPLERAFGYAPVETKLPYLVMNENWVWVDDPKSSRYNMLTTRSEAGSVSSEEMKRRDDLYKYGIVVEYNTKQILPGAGSAIFFHIWRGPSTSTAGCIATSEENILRLLRWFDPSRKPFTLIGVCPAE